VVTPAAVSSGGRAPNDPREIRRRRLEERQDEALHMIHKANKRMGLNAAMQEFVQFSRVFGVRVWLPIVESTDPLYYELPFNPDGVMPGSYRGMTQVDPYWITPILDAAASSNPANMGFYEPTWWQINGKLYHRTHLVVAVPFPVADILKPSYRYGGVPLPQRIMERVYAAERTANEAPLLAMTKRLLTWKTDLAEKLLDQPKTEAHLQGLTEWRDNFGVNMVDTDDDVTQTETSLADLDDVIMSQYVIVAAIAGMPVTKLMGTPPKGMNATGEGDAENYQQNLESIQTNDLEPLLERHLLLLARSEIEPAFGLSAGSVEITSDWNPLDSPSAKEYAEIDKIKAERDEVLANTGAIDGMDIRARLRNDRGGDYTDLPEITEAEAEESDLLAEAQAADAAPRPLYVSRKLVNVAEVNAWAKSQGLPALKDAHVTVTRSRTPVDWMTMGDNWSSDMNGNFTIEPGGARIVEPLGDKGAVVLLFNSSALAYRHESMRDKGASWDYPTYQPHVTLTYEGAGLDLSKVEPYRGKLVFGPEVFEDFVDNWRPDGDA
jgi:phage-related protein (TIGR01555 family)